MTSPDDTPQEHYFSATAPQPEQVSWVPQTLAGREVEVAMAPGVFSHGHLDLGTRVLLREVPDPPATGTLLDLGCGWGPLALTMGLLSPQAQVWAVDVNDRAVDLVRQSAQRLDLPGLHPARPEEVPADLRFDTIWSNPPIRIGKAALHTLLLDWLPRLAPDGTAYLVVQRHLGADSLLSWLSAQPGLTARKAASAKGFRVIEVARRPD